MGRILRPGGVMLVYVWALEQADKKYTVQDVLVPWHLQDKHKKVNEEEESKEEGKYEEKSGMKVYKRYYHMFKQGELEDLVNQMNIGAQIIRNYYDHANWCILISKP